MESWVAMPGSLRCHRPLVMQPPSLLLVAVCLEPAPRAPELPAQHTSDVVFIFLGL